METMMSSDRTALDAALAYFRPVEDAKGPVFLHPQRVREHLAVIEAALRTDTDPSLERVEAMREACAKVAEATTSKAADRAVFYGSGFADAAREIAAAIRALPVTNEGAGSC